MAGRQSQSATSRERRKNGKASGAKGASRTQNGARRAKAQPTEKPNGKAGKNGASQAVSLVASLASRAERAIADARMQQVDAVCAAWAAVLAERMAADEAFTELYESWSTRPNDLRSLFLLDGLHAAESRLSLVNGVIARHLDAGGKADALAMLEDLRAAQRRTAAVQTVNAFLAVLHQMRPDKPRWVGLDDDFDARVAVLALAHQSIAHALEQARIEAPADLTEEILRAATHESVWVHDRRLGEEEALEAACAASAVLFGAVGATELADESVLRELYDEQAARKSRPPPSAS